MGYNSVQAVIIHYNRTQMGFNWLQAIRNIPPKPLHCKVGYNWLEVATTGYKTFQMGYNALQAIFNDT